jgi:hypothetical protein
MTGRRLPDGFDCTTPSLQALGLSSIPLGAYWKDGAGEWTVMTPNHRLGSIANHNVVEHEDQTITVSPSILVYAHAPVVYTPEERARMVDMVGEERVQMYERGKPEYHGFLERGVWRSC